MQETQKGHKLSDWDKYFATIQMGKSRSRSRSSGSRGKKKKQKPSRYSALDYNIRQAEVNVKNRDTSLMVLPSNNVAVNKNLME
jgi:hypothetical protein